MMALRRRDRSVGRSRPGRRWWPLAALLPLVSCTLVNELDECLIPGECEPPPPPESGDGPCANGLDDDGDGATDCSDPGCVAAAGCLEQDVAACGDGVDNDLDGGTDCGDPSCCRFTPCWTSCPFEALPRSNAVTGFEFVEDFEDGLSPAVWTAFGESPPRVEDGEGVAASRALAFDPAAPGSSGIVSVARPFLLGRGLAVQFELRHPGCYAGPGSDYVGTVVAGLALDPDRGVTPEGSYHWLLGLESNARAYSDDPWSHYLDVYVWAEGIYTFHRPEPLDPDGYQIVELVSPVAAPGEPATVEAYLDGELLARSVVTLEELSGPVAVMVKGYTLCGGLWVDDLQVTAPAGRPAGAFLENPVFVPEAGAWDGWGPVAPTVAARPDGGYAMWYGSASRADPVWQIGRAESDDGVTWARTPGSTGGPVLGPGLGAPSTVVSYTEYPTVAVDPDTGELRMWYQGDWVVRQASSTDGVRWTHVGSTQLESDTLVETPLGTLYGLSAVWDGSAWVLYYGAKAAEGESSIRRVRAADPAGLEFDLTDRRVVLEAGLPGEWDSAGVLYPQVLRTEDGGWLMVYVGLDFPMSGVGLAVSRDGETWEKRPGGPVIRPLGYGFDSSGYVAGAAAALYGGGLRLWYSSYDDGGYGLGVADVSFVLPAALAR
jgi:hypothetical protein